MSTKKTWKRQQHFDDPPLSEPAWGRSIVVFKINLEDKRCGAGPGPGERLAIWVQPDGSELLESWSNLGLQLVSRPQRERKKIEQKHPQVSGECFFPVLFNWVISSWFLFGSLPCKLRLRARFRERSPFQSVKICQKNGDWNAEIENAKDVKMICRKNLHMEKLCKSHLLESSQTHFIPSVGTLELIRCKQISGFSSKLMALRI